MEGMENTEHATAQASALAAAVTAGSKDYRMAGFPRPFTAQGRAGDRFNHLFRAGEHLALCGGLAVCSPTRLRPADLTQIDCIACLDAYTAAHRPPTPRDSAEVEHVLALVDRYIATGNPVIRDRIRESLRRLARP